MTPNHYIHEKWVLHHCHPFKKGWLGYQVYKSHRVYGLVYKFLHVKLSKCRQINHTWILWDKDLRPPKVQKMMVGRGSYPFRARSIFRGKAPKNQDIPPGESRKIIDSKVPVKDDDDDDDDDVDDDDDDDRVWGNLWNPPPLHNVKLRGKTYIPSHHGTTGTRWLPVRLRPTWRSWKRVWNAYSAMVSTRWMSLAFFFREKNNRGKHPWVFVLNLAANNKVENTWEIYVFVCFCLFVLGVRKVDVYWKLFVNLFGKSWLLFCSRWSLYVRLRCLRFLFHCFHVWVQTCVGDLFVKDCGCGQMFLNRWFDDLGLSFLVDYSRRGESLKTIFKYI